MSVFLFAASLLCNKALLHGHKRVQQGGVSQSLQCSRPHYSSAASFGCVYLLVPGGKTAACLRVWGSVNAAARSVN